MCSLKDATYFGDEGGIAEMASPSSVPEPYGALPLAFGQPGAFNGQVESFTAYMECVQIFFEANDVPARKRLSVFLSIIGGTAYTLLWNLLSLVPPKEKSLEEVSPESLLRAKAHRNR